MTQSSSVNTDTAAERWRELGLFSVTAVLLRLECKSSRKNLVSSDKSQRQQWYTGWRGTFLEWQDVCPVVTLVL